MVVAAALATVVVAPVSLHSPLADWRQEGEAGNHVLDVVQRSVIYLFTKIFAKEKETRTGSNIYPNVEFDDAPKNQHC